MSRCNEPSGARIRAFVRPARLGTIPQQGSGVGARRHGHADRYTTAAPPLLESQPRRTSTGAPVDASWNQRLNGPVASPRSLVLTFETGPGTERHGVSPLRRPDVAHSSRWMAIVLMVASVAISCGATLDRTAADYRQNKSEASLASVAKSLRKGMPRTEVERLLGVPDYSPTVGQFYYSSERDNYGLVVDYRRDGHVTDQLQEFSLGTIGE
jgi:hypothetical protein